MPATTRFAYPYPSPTDAPDGPSQMQALAVQNELWSSRAYPVLNAAARTALSGQGEGFLCRQRDDGSVWIWTDLSTWVQIYPNDGSDGGGTGGIGALTGEWSASSVQTFHTGSSTITPLALANENRALAGVVRSTKGVGHKFTCNAGTYLAACTVRFADDDDGSKFVALRAADDSIQYWQSQDDSSGGVTTRNFAGPVVLDVTTDLYVAVSQSTGSNLSTQPTGSVNPSGYVKLALTRIG